MTACASESLAPRGFGRHRTCVRILILLLLIIGGLYLVLALFLYFFQGRVVYLPERHLAIDPARVGLPYENVIISAGPDTLHGWFVPADSGAPVVLFCHGNAGNIGDRLDVLEQIHDSGLAVFIFDYSGYGQSTGSPSEGQTYDDADRAYRWLSDRGYSDGNIIVYGRSLGSAVAAHVSQGKPLRAVVLEATFPSLSDVARVHYGWLPVRLLVRLRYPTADYLKNIRAPLFIVHNRNDEISPFALGEKVFAAAPEPKTFIAADGWHNSVTPIDWRAIASPGSRDSVSSD
jgi:fermentation-respiration switch protein FrsA (DUF1100 family)